jgi:class 3 adenylate cyclase
LTLTDKWRRFGHDIGFGIGIAHGFATLGTIGFEGRFDYAAIGTVSNVASRLCDEVKPGQILVSPRVLVAVEDVVKVEPVGEFELKGIRRPLAAYNVVSTNLENARPWSRAATSVVDPWRRACMHMRVARGIAAQADNAPDPQG